MGANQDLVCDMDNCLINTKLDSSSFFIYILEYARGPSWSLCVTRGRPYGNVGRKEKEKKLRLNTEYGVHAMSFINVVAWERVQAPDG